MSGIACLFHTDGSPTDPETIKAMTRAMAYRGPDGIAHWHDGQIALGHCQMHSTTESLEERQPLGNDAGSVVLAMDGYLTNCDELRADLLARGARLRDRSDAELVLRAYEEWGADCPRHIDGEYAFVLWDAARREVFCARDHQGLRPLLYHWDGETLLVASDAAAILAVLDERPPLNLGFLAEFMTGLFYSLDETIWKGVLRLDAAHAMRVGTVGPQNSRYWSLPLEVTLTYKRDEDYVDHYRALLEDCLRRAARTHKPLACDVSGGLDSSALFCLAAQMQRERRLPAPALNGYTLAGPVGSRADEIHFARDAAKAAGLPLREVPLYMPGLDWFTNQAQTALDLPVVPNTAMCLTMQQAMVADGCRVNINGLGGDQWLSGSGFYYQQAIMGGDIGRLFGSLRRDVADFGWSKAARMLLYFGLSPSLPPGLRKPLQQGWRTLRRDRSKMGPDLSWLAPEIQRELATRKQRCLDHWPESPLDRLKVQRISEGYLASMFDFNNRQFAQVGFEMRHPMLARAFAEFSVTTPEYTRRQGKADKLVHRAALGDILPDSIRKRTNKAEFSVTYYHLEDAIGQIVERGLDPTFPTLGNAAGASKVLATYCNAAIDNKLTHDIWGLYVVNMLLGLNQSEGVAAEGSSHDQLDQQC